MNVQPAARWLGLTIASILLAVALIVIMSSAVFTRADGHSVDTETVTRLTHSRAKSDGIRATADITGTNAALLAAGVLLDNVLQDVYLPAIIK